MILLLLSNIILMIEQGTFFFSRLTYDDLGCEVMNNSCCIQNRSASVSDWNKSVGMYVHVRISDSENSVFCGIKRVFITSSGALVGLCQRCQSLDLGVV